MKAIAILVGFLCCEINSLGQGGLIFANSPTTLISSDGVPVPARTSLDTTFFFAVFLAPSTTVAAAGFTPAFTDPNFQIVDPNAYTTNSPLQTGRLPYRSLDIGAAQGYVPGSTVDFIVRGWSANAGGTWGEALAAWNNGAPATPMHIGSSTVGNNFILAGGTFPYSTVFGTAYNQVSGFDMVFVPEPSALALAVLGGTALWVNVRLRRRTSK